MTALSDSQVAKQATMTVPIAEVFGPTIQGEGPLAGVPTAFVRVGGCDYKCSWCDSLHAVLPEHVRKLDRWTPEQIRDAVRDVTDGTAAKWVTISGGNPAMYEQLGHVADMLVDDLGLYVAVETQASRWQDWLSGVDQLVLSPKPPSSGMWTDAHAEETQTFFERLASAGSRGAWRPAIKLVVFDDDDYEWAAGRSAWWSLQGRLYLSVGTRSIEEEPVEDTLRRFQWLAEKVAHDHRWRGLDVSVLPQLHVLAWGHRLGV